jgi:hypothetical protein
MWSPQLSACRRTRRYADLGRLNARFRPAGTQESLRAAPGVAATTAAAEPVRSQVPAAEVAVGDEMEVPTEHPSAAGPAVSAGPEAPEPTSTQRGDVLGVKDVDSSDRSG